MLALPNERPRACLSRSTNRIATAYCTPSHRRSREVTLGEGSRRHALPSRSAARFVRAIATTINQAGGPTTATATSASMICGKRP